MFETEKVIIIWSPQMREHESRAFLFFLVWTHSWKYSGYVAKLSSLRNFSLSASCFQQEEENYIWTFFQEESSNNMSIAMFKGFFVNFFSSSIFLSCSERGWNSKSYPQHGTFYYCWCGKIEYFLYLYTFDEGKGSRGKAIRKGKWEKKTWKKNNVGNVRTIYKIKIVFLDVFC